MMEKTCMANVIMIELHFGILVEAVTKMGIQQEVYTLYNHFLA